MLCVLLDLFLLFAFSAVLFFAIPLSLCFSVLHFLLPLLVNTFCCYFFFPLLLWLVCELYVLLMLLLLLLSLPTRMLQSCSSLVAFAASVCPFGSCFVWLRPEGDWLSARLRGLLQQRRLSPLLPFVSLLQLNWSNLYAQHVKIVVVNTLIAFHVSVTKIQRERERGVARPTLWQLHVSCGIRRYLWPCLSWVGVGERGRREAEGEWRLGSTRLELGQSFSRFSLFFFLSYFGSFLLVFLAAAAFCCNASSVFPRHFFGLSFCLSVCLTVCLSDPFLAVLWLSCLTQKVRLKWCVNAAQVVLQGRLTWKEISKGRYGRDVQENI